MQEQESPAIPNDASSESFLGSFNRVPSGLDPTQVYSYFLKMSARISQLEEQARRVSAPFLLESAMREAAEVRTQAAQAAERTYNEIVQAAQQETERIRAEAQRQAAQIIEEGRASIAGAQRQAEEIIEQARQEAARIRREAEEQNERDEQEFERLCVDFAAFLQHLLDRRKGASAAAVGDTARPAPPSIEPAPPPGADQERKPDQPGRHEPGKTADSGDSGFRLPSWLDL